MELKYVAIRYQGDFDALVRRLRLEGELIDEFRPVFEACREIANPQGVFTSCPVRQEGPYTFVGDTRFESRVLTKNFHGVDTVYPYLVTCGRALYDKACGTADTLERYWVDTIAEAALREVGAALHRAVRETFGLDKMSAVNPGSLADFPLKCQRPLFDLMGEGPARVGLELTPTFLMLPYKSGSGIYFTSDGHYENCMLCPKMNCPGRRASYSPEMVASYGLTVPDRLDIQACQLGAPRMGM